MQGFSVVLGQPNAVNILKSSLQAGRTAHAYLFTGPSGVGKKLTAGIFARALNCDAQDRPCDYCVSCQKAIHFNHPDIIYLKPEGLSFKIEQVRNLQKQVHTRVYEGKYKVFVIEDIHKATLQASNSLLKTLEEPPGNSVFILLTDNSYALPQTIISRCQRINFAPLDNAVIEDFFINKGYDRARARLAAELSSGSLGRGFQVIESDEFLHIRQKAIEFLQVAFSGNRFNLFKVIEGIDKEKSDIILLLEQMLTLLRNLSITKLNPNFQQGQRGLDLSTEQLESCEAVYMALDSVLWASELAKKQTNARLLLDVLGLKLAKLA